MSDKAWKKVADLSDKALDGLKPVAEAVGSALAGVGNALVPRAEATFIGENAKTFDHEALKKAKEMRKEYVSRDKIWKETGSYLASDGKWRQEISDKGMGITFKDRSGRVLPDYERANLIQNRGQPNKKTTMPLNKLGNVLEHDALLEAYPDLKPINFYNTATTATRGTGENSDRYSVPTSRASYSYWPVSPTKAVEDIYLQDLTDYDKERFGLQRNSMYSSKESLMLHELQHAVQKREGFTNGGEPSSDTDSAYDKYLRIHGEAEARNTARRMNFTDQQRRSTPPWETLDIPERELTDKKGKRIGVPIGRLRKLPAGAKRIGDVPKKAAALAGAAVIAASTAAAPSPEIFYGNDAVAKVVELEGELTPLQRAVVLEEGYVDAVYEDDAATSGIRSENVKTRGVGQTGKYMDMTFKESFEAKLNEAKELFPNFDNLSHSQQEAIISTHYRGDTRLRSGKVAAWVGLVNEGKFEEASVELLDHKEYKERKKKGRDGVVKRLEKASEGLKGK